MNLREMGTGKRLPTMNQQPIDGLWWFFLISGLAYVQDLDTLRNVPNAIWNLVCGLPLESGVTLPLQWAISIVAFLAAGMLSGVRWWVSRRQE